MSEAGNYFAQVNEIAAQAVKERGPGKERVEQVTDLCAALAAIVSNDNALSLIRDLIGEEKRASETDSYFCLLERGVSSDSGIYKINLSVNSKPKPGDRREIRLTTWKREGRGGSTEVSYFKQLPLPEVLGHTDVRERKRLLTQLAGQDEQDRPYLFARCTEGEPIQLPPTLEEELAGISDLPEEATGEAIMTNFRQLFSSNSPTEPSPNS